MKYSYKWLKELSKTEKTVEEIADLLTKYSFEVEGIIYQNQDLKGVVVGEVLKIEAHPNADKLKIANVDIGSEILTIVCGAKNLKVGQKVPIATIGTILPTDDKKGLKIKKSKIRSIESHGMICAEDELGIGIESKGIMVLDKNSKVGEKFDINEGLDDVILDIDILPNRGHDALSHRGMAAEIATLERRVLEKVNIKNYSLVCENIDVNINTDKCYRYTAISFDNVKITESPKWIKNRLKLSGIASINNIVDISNYVMLEIGQPSHAYSKDKLSNSLGEIVFEIKKASKRENFKLLNNEIIELSGEEIIVECNEKLIALAGIMGGIDSSVSESDDEIIFEIANFEYSSIRKTKSRHSLKTDAAYRFERDIDLNLIDLAIFRIIELVSQIAGGQVKCVKDNYNKRHDEWNIFINNSEIKRLLGVDVEQKEIVNILKSLGIDVFIRGDKYECKIPTIRRDLRDTADIIEEIGRIYGYDKITPKPFNEEVQPPIRNYERFFERNTKEFLVNSGFDEIKSYSFYAKKESEILGIYENKHIKVLNPINNDYSLMRNTLIVGALKACSRNLSNYEYIRLFEIGRIYNKTNVELPKEVSVISLLISTPKNDGSQFYELKGEIEEYLNSVGIEDVYFDDEFDTYDSFTLELHWSRKALIKLSTGEIIGILGEVSKKSMKFFGIKKQRATVCELNLDSIYSNSKKNDKFEQLSKFPIVFRDLSMIVESKTRVADVERSIYESGGELLVDVDLFDLYVDSETAERSMAFHLIFSHPERTLNAKEIDKIIGDIIKAIESSNNIEVKR